jgi:hypothetical protein
MFQLILAFLLKLNYLFHPFEYLLEL